MRKKRILYILGSIVLLVLIVLGVLVVTGGNRIYKESMNRSTNESTSDAILTEWLTEAKGFDLEAFRRNYTIEEIEIESSLDGHIIPASYIYADGNTDKTGNTVIMVHGLLSNRLSNYPMAQLFLSEGFNVITYDQRSSGGNTSAHTTYGYLESRDTLDCMNYALENMTANGVLGMWGQSMGAATIMNAMNEDGFSRNIAFVVLDSPLGDMEDALGSPDILSRLQVQFASLLCDMKLGFRFSDQSVYPQIRNTTVPVMVAASEADSKLPYDMQLAIYDSLRETTKSMYTVSDSNHADIYFDHPDEYQQKLDDFLQEFVFKTK